MYWANFLHFYQPPTQKKYWIDRVTEESYQRLLRELRAAPKARVTMNINAVLIEFWDKFGYQDVIRGYRDLLERGQIELTASAKYHPLLPRIPREEMIRQVEISNETYKKHFGDLYRPKGFFPPEMAYDREVAEMVASLGFEWIIVEELSFAREFNKVDYRQIYQVKGTSVKGREEPLKIFFRERDFSYKVLSGQLGTASLFLKALGKRFERDEYLLTAMDGETFGHHRPGMEKLLFELYKTPGLKTALLSELPAIFPKREETETRPATWALMQKDLEKNIPFARWDDPDNQIHQMQWELTDLAIKAVRRFSQSGKGRDLLDKALHSDQYWWACARPWWSLEMIERGAYELKEAVRASKGGKREDVDKAEELYYKIITTGFQWQRSGKVEELAKKEDETMRMLADKNVPDLPKREIRKMAETIRAELRQVVKKEEYERAIQLRDRIKELEGYIKGEGTL
jgi:predicted glycosyl hydrolase (DUF1957 family)